MKIRHFLFFSSKTYRNFVRYQTKLTICNQITPETLYSTNLYFTFCQEMKKFKSLTLIALSMMLGATSANAVSNINTPEQKQSLTNALQHYLPGTTGFGQATVDSIAVDSSKNVIMLFCNGNTTYIPFTADKLLNLKSEIKSLMGEGYNNYTVKLTSRGRDLDDLVLFSPKKNIGPTEAHRFIDYVDELKFKNGLDGANIALWQSHGWYFEPKLNRWEWQRARVMQTVEDLYTQSYVMPFLMPMLENAGAYVMSPRERDYNLNELVIDNDKAFAVGEYSETGTWQDSPVAGFAFAKEKLHNGDNPFRMGTARTAQVSKNKDKAAKAVWSADIPQDGNYAVYVSYVSEPNSTADALYTISDAAGQHNVKVNQTMGGGTWIYLGHYPFKAGKQDVVTLSSFGKDASKVVTADAVKIGGGMGNVERIVIQPLDSIDYKYVGSNYPRFVEGARYFLQYAGAPDSVYTPSGNINDYTDDYRSRGLWVNWLTGGSSMLPAQEGLNIPVDLSFAFHTDAGTTLNDSIIGTLGIYCTVGDTLGNGTSRDASRDLTDLVMTEIVSSARAEFEPNWTRRGMWDQSYYEARVPQVPSMLLELLSHQNLADMKYGLDPNFRFAISRAIYKGMLKFLAQRDGRKYTVQPLPVNSFSIRQGKKAGKYSLEWQPTPDSLEITATPSYYLVEERVNDGAFKQIAQVKKPVMEVEINDNEIHSYRIIAGNDGGISFPSEILALRRAEDDSQPILIVNSFTRVSAPDTFDSGEIAGFYDIKDHGVPYINDISFIGSQFEFRRDIPWMDDDAAGFGASRANYEDKVIAGNTFDFVYTHGVAIKNAGKGFISTGIDAFVQDSYPVPGMIDLIMGKQKEIKRGSGAYGTYYKTFTPELQAKLRKYALDGGNIFVTGAYIASDLWDNPYSSVETLINDQKFAAEVLGYKWRVDQASVTGEAYEVASRFRDFDGGEFKFSNTLNADSYVVESPDSFYPANDKTAATFMRYTENNLIAGTIFDSGKHRTVAVGFPFESITDRNQADRLMKQAVKFLYKTIPGYNLK